MGRKTEDARCTLHTYHTQKKMQAALYFENPEGEVVRGIADYGGDGDHDHVEFSLMRILNTLTENFAKITDKSVLIFAAKWSPCVQCTTKLIPDFLRVIRLAGRPLRVKFRFERYYTAANWAGDVRAGGGRHFWATEAAAQLAYDKLAATFGNYSAEEYGVREAINPATNLAGTEVALKVKAKLVIQPCSVHTTSRCETFFV